MCHPITSFFETIDEPGVIVLVRITEVRTMEKRSLTPAPSCPHLCLLSDVHRTSSWNRSRPVGDFLRPTRGELTVGFVKRIL